MTYLAVVRLHSTKPRIRAYALTSELSGLHLPLLVECIEQPSRLPQSVRKQADEVAVGGIDELHRRVRDMRASARGAARALESVRAQLFAPEGPAALQMQWHELERAASEAAASDDVIAGKLARPHELWVAMEHGPKRLSEVLAPRFAALDAARRDAMPTLRALRAALEHVSDEADARKAILRRLHAAAEHDDISGALHRAAHAIRGDSLVAVDAAQLESVLDDELQKYRRGESELDQSGRRQSEHLAQAACVRSELMRNVLVARGLAERKEAFRQVSEAHAQYTDVALNIAEGSSFYDALSARLGEFCAQCDDWMRGAAPAPTPAPQWGSFPGGNIHFAE